MAVVRSPAMEYGIENSEIIEGKEGVRIILDENIVNHPKEVVRSRNFFVFKCMQAPHDVFSYLFMK
jgi:hypothetical protein